MKFTSNKAITYQLIAICLAITSVDIEAKNLSDDELMTCSGSDVAIPQLKNLRAMWKKQDEIKAEIDAIDEREAKALVDGVSSQDESQQRAQLVANFNVIDRVADKKSAEFSPWYSGCQKEIASRQARAEEARQAKKEAERKRKEAKEAEEAKQKFESKTPAERGAEVHKYAALISATVERYMILDPSMRGKTCTLGVELASTGFVISVDNGRGDPAVCRSGKAAVLKANQLPVPKDPAAFEMVKKFNLKLDPNI